MRRTLLLFLFVGVLVAMQCVAAAPIRVTMPAAGSTVVADAPIFCIGAVPPTTRLLTIDGVEVPVYRTGTFIAQLPATPGKRTLKLVADGVNVEHTFTLKTSAQDAASRPPRKRIDLSTVTNACDKRLEMPWRAYRTRDTLFANRVRTGLGSGDTVAYLPKNSLVQGAPVRGTGYVLVWLNNTMYFIESRRVVPDSTVRCPPRTIPIPDITKGFATEPPFDRAPKDIVIMLDAGHGGDDSGALGPRGLEEKDANLRVAWLTYDALRAAGYTVRMTRKRDTTVQLQARPELALTQHVDAFISIHHNSTALTRDPREVRHVVTYFENTLGERLARAIHPHVAQASAGIPDKGVRRESFLVCRNPAVPSCLIEVDFINCPEGEEKSFDMQQQQRIADAIVAGVAAWHTRSEQKQ